MGNMSYCRFRNTTPDLQDCSDTLDESGWQNLSYEELRSCANLISICVEIAQNYGDELPVIRKEIEKLRQERASI